MFGYGFKMPPQPRKTALFDAEEWYQNLLAEKLGIPYSPIQRSNFGQYHMAVHYLTSVMEEAKAIEKVAVYNIDHMAQINFRGKDACALLDRVLPANVESMKIGQCKYTLLLNDNGGVLDDLIIMKRAEDSFILVINAGHDLSDEQHGLISDTDFIMQHLHPDDEVFVEDLSDQLVKVDVQGPYSYKLITEIFGSDVLKNRNDKGKNMSYFTFNEVILPYSHDFTTQFINDQSDGHNNLLPIGQTYFFSRTGYTNRWGWEIYIPQLHAIEKFKQIVLKAMEYGGLLVGLGGRDDNRLSAGNVGLPLMGKEYNSVNTPTNVPLFHTAVDLQKPDFVGKQQLLKDIEIGLDQRMVIIISEGNVINNDVYINGVRQGTVTSCIMSPNVPLEKRLFIGSERKSVNEENGIAAIALAWLNHSPYQKDEHQVDIITIDEKPIRIPVELYRVKEGQPVGNPVLGYISADGVNPPTAAKPLKNIEQY